MHTPLDMLALIQNWMEDPTYLHEHIHLDSEHTHFICWERITDNTARLTIYGRNSRRGSRILEGSQPDEIWQALAELLAGFPSSGSSQES